MSKLIFKNALRPETARYLETEIQAVAVEAGTVFYVTREWTEAVRYDRDSAEPELYEKPAAYFEIYAERNGDAIDWQDSAATLDEAKAICDRLDAERVEKLKRRRASRSAAAALWSAFRYGSN